MATGREDQPSLHYPPIHIFRLLLLYPQSYSCQLSEINLSHWSLSSGIRIIHLFCQLTRKHSFRIPIPAQLFFYNPYKQQLYPEFLSSLQTSIPAEKPHFYHLYVRPYSFSHYPLLMRNKKKKNSN